MSCPTSGAKISALASALPAAATLLVKCFDEKNYALQGIDKTAHISNIIELTYHNNGNISAIPHETNRKIKVMKDSKIIDTLNAPTVSSWDVKFNIPGYNVKFLKIDPSEKVSVEDHFTIHTSEKIKDENKVFDISNITHEIIANSETDSPKWDSLVTSFHTISDETNCNLTIRDIIGTINRMGSSLTNRKHSSVLDIDVLKLGFNNPIHANTIKKVSEELVQKGCWNHENLIKDINKYYSENRPYNDTISKLTLNFQFQHQKDIVKQPKFKPVPVSDAEIYKLACDLEYIINGISNKCPFIQKRQEYLESEINSLRARVEALESEKAEVFSENAALKDKVSMIESEKNIFSEQFEKQRNQIIELQDLNKQLIEQIVNMQTNAKSEVKTAIIPYNGLDNVSLKHSSMRGKTKSEAETAVSTFISGIENNINGLAKTHPKRTIYNALLESIKAISSATWNKVITNKETGTEVRAIYKNYNSYNIHESYNITKDCVPAYVFSSMITDKATKGIPKVLYLTLHPDSIYSLMVLGAEEVSNTGLDTGRSYSILQRFNDEYEHTNTKQFKNNNDKSYLSFEMVIALSSSPYTDADSEKAIMEVIKRPDEVKEYFRNIIPTAMFDKLISAITEFFTEEESSLIKSIYTEDSKKRIE